MISKLKPSRLDKSYTKIHIYFEGDLCYKGNDLVFVVKSYKEQKMA